MLLQLGDCKWSCEAIALGGIDGDEIGWIEGGKKQIINNLLWPARNLIIVLQVKRKWLINFKEESDNCIQRIDEHEDR